MPWFAWIPIIAIIAWGVIQITSMMTGRPIPGDGDSTEEIEELRERIRALEAGRASRSNRAFDDEGLDPLELERRIQRLETRIERRLTTQEQQDEWDAQARQLGIPEADKDKRVDD